MVKRAPFLALILALVFSASVAAQQASQQQQQQPQAEQHFSLAQRGQADQAVPPISLRVTTQLVQVNVVAHDRKGQPVAGLTKDDFVLLEDGKPRKISVFAVESSEKARRAVPALPPDTFSNEVERQVGAPTSATVILIDTLNTRFLDQNRARQAVVKFLSSLQAQDRIAIFALGTRLRVLHDFSRDTDSLKRTLARYEGRVNAEMDASTETPEIGDEEIDAALKEMAEKMANIELAHRVRTTMNAITAIAEYLIRLPGRKNLVWVSGSFPFSYGLDRLMEGRRYADVNFFGQEIERASRAVNKSNIAIYPVDARGLLGLADIMPTYDVGSRTPDSRRSRAAADLQGVTQHEQSLLTMRRIADLTGGRAFYNTNDIVGSVREAIDDTRLTYVLGFYPGEQAWDAKLHKLEVQVKRPGVEVRHRQGFYAINNEQANEEHRRKLMEEASVAPLEATAIGLTVHLGPPAGPGQPRQFEITLDPRDLSLEERNGFKDGQVAMFFLQKTVEGKALDSRGEDVSVHVSQASYEEMIANGLTISAEWALRPEAELMRLVVCDPRSLKIGTITVPLPRPESAAKPKRR